MFALRSAASKISARSFSTAPKAYKLKTTKEAWLSDSGSYPVIVCIAGAVALSISYTMKCTFAHPDSRIFAADRKALFRGELKPVKLEV